MCGIAGIFANGDTGPSVDEVEAMLACLVHRGPDDEGTLDLGRLAFGMRRLSILDPSELGHQPMQSADGRLSIVHNGEIYNFLELAAELEAAGHRFASASDTEVILAAYAQWGADCVKRFNGIWAFALWDATDQRLLLSRDRFGVKPLFVTQSGGRIAFASEIKALLALPWVSSEPEPSAIRDFLVDGMVDHTDRTFFRDIRRVPAATSLAISPAGSMTIRYWGPPDLTDDASDRPDPSDSRRVDEFRELLVDSVALQLRSDVPLGSCLSGGLDSSAIVSIASGLRHGHVVSSRSTRRDRDAAPQLAFFAEFRDPGIDERPYVDAVVEQTGVTLATTTPDRASFVDSIAEIVRVQDEPFGSTSIVAQYFVMKLAHESGVKVLLDGQGADELVGGYPPYVAMRVAGGLRQGDPGTRRRFARTVLSRSVPVLPTLGHALLGGGRLPEAVRRNRMPTAWLGEATRRAGSLDAPLDVPAGTVLARNLWRQIASENLPALLRFEDRNSMAFGIESRVPFLDHRLVEAALLLPDRLKIRPGEQKIALRRAMDGIVPRPVLDRRDKVAFQAPQRRWLMDSLTFVNDVLSTPRIERFGYLDSGRAAGTVAGFATGQVGDVLAWRILSLELWLRTIVQ